MSKFIYRGNSYDDKAQANVANPKGNSRENLLYRGFVQTKAVSANIGAPGSQRQKEKLCYRGYKVS